ncbi:DUF732 domain-containing protein [Mycobacterium sp. 1245805.9]|uniref:DUF732 domain-containing protein n=1 Tax=Mycobacterium sp. 1245805.9 TaxID=1856862 RepID=UPI000800206D|nr:DUF732 domain-containing protein [Mycobacterium sp. 1245805.9]OBI82943.1 hypothetical protein A9X00_06245 [Mycobacterium sp. 1245805.9]
MARTNAGPAKWSTACGVVLAAAALLGAAPAAAEPIDDAFVAALARNGISMSDRGTAVSMGHSVCAGFDKGEASTAVAMGIVKDTPLSPKQAGYFVGLSVAAYCPQYKGKTDNSMTWMVPFPPMM